MIDRKKDGSTRSGDNIEKDALIQALKDRNLALEKELQAGQEELRAQVDVLRRKNDALESRVRECKQVEEALKLSRFSLDQASDSIFWLRPDGGFYDVNEAPIKLLGYGREELLQMSVWDIDPDIDSKRFRELWEETRRHGSIIFETRVRAKDGTLYQVEVTGNCLVFGGQEYIFAFVKDITERKRAEEMLRKNERYLENIFESFQEGISILDKDYNIVKANRAMEKWYSHMFPLVGKKCYQAYRMRTSVCEDCPSLRAMREKRMQMSTVPYINKSGISGWMELYSFPLIDDQGNVIGVIEHVRDITERKRMEEELLKSESRLRQTEQILYTSQEAGAVGSWYLDLRKNYLWWSPETYRIFGLPPGTPLDYETFLSYVHEDDRMAVDCAWKAALTGIPYNIEHRIVTGGETKWVQEKAVLEYDEQRAPVSGIGTVLDITERKKSEEAIKLASAYNRSLIEASLDPLVTISPEGVITDVNKATEKVTGYPREELIGTDFSLYFTEPKKAREGYLAVFKEGSVKDYPLEIRHRDGRLTPVVYNASIYRDETGRVIGVFAAARDITEQKKMEEARSRLAAIVDFSDDAIIGKTLDGIITSWNAGAVRIYGYTEDEVLGKSIQVLSMPGNMDEIPYILNKIRRGEHIDHYETLRKRKDGRIINVSLSVSPIKDAKGRLVGASSITRDITEKKQVEEAIRLASAYNRSLIEASLDPLVTISPEGVITDVNKATEKVTGYPREELIGTDFSLYFTEPKKAREGYMKAFDAGSVMDYPLEIRHRSGQITPVIYNASVYRNESGEVIGVFAAARDISARKLAEENLKEAKAEAELYLDLMGHDIRNMNMICMGFLELALGSPDINRHDKELLLKSMGSLENSTRLIDNVRKLQKARSGELKRYKIDACQTFIRVLAHYSSMPGVRASFSYEIPPCCPVMANELLYEVFENLVGNAIKHGGPEPVIDIRFELVAPGGRMYDRFIVEDNGPGIPDALKDRIFNRLQRGNSKSKGMGLGLYLVKSLVESYGGQVWVEDRVPGDHTKGAKFVVMLPVAGNTD